MSQHPDSDRAAFEKWAAAATHRFRRKAAEVTAIQWDGTWDGWQAVVKFDGQLDRTMLLGDDTLAVETASAGRDHYAVAGDWIIKDPDGSLSVVKEGMFGKLYEAVE